MSNEGLGKTAEGKGLVATAVIVQQLRDAIYADDWTTVCLLSFHVIEVCRWSKLLSRQTIKARSYMLLPRYKLHEISWCIAPTKKTASASLTTQQPRLTQLRLRLVSKKVKHCEWMFNTIGISFEALVLFIFFWF